MDVEVKLLIQQMHSMLRGLDNGWPWQELGINLNAIEAKMARLDIDPEDEEGD